jgi:hypothetical protein
MDLKYKLYVIGESGQFGELECEDLDIITSISINDIADITVKKDTISKNITIKGTKNNNRILGNLTNLSRYVDDSSEQLNYNYSMSRPVECIILENSELLVKGFLKIINVTQNNGVIQYEALVTGQIVNFYSQLKDDSMLSDLDFSEYSHPFYLNAIQNSWDTSIMVNGGSVPFQLGKGYVYPMVNYGEMNSPTATDVNKIHITNFRPAIYLKVYLDKIFNSLEDFTYEIKGNEAFKNEINSLVIPNDQQSLNQTTKGTLISMSNGGTITSASSVLGSPGIRKILRFADVNDPQNLIDQNTQNFRNETSNIFIWNRDVKSDMGVSFNFTATNTDATNIACSVKLLVRGYNRADAYNDDLNTFTVAAEAAIGTVLSNSTLTTTCNFKVPEREYKKDSQFMIVVHSIGVLGIFLDKYDFQLTNLALKTPSTAETSITINIMEGDTITPQPVSNVKTKDFIKSLTLLFNLYTYSTYDNPKHIIFESYKDYYADTMNGFVADKAMDWSNKIDTTGFSIAPYTNNNKSYSFVYRSDTDYWNSQYTSAYGEVYGSYTETDTYKYAANKEVKKIELVFSPTPIINYGGTDRIYPEIVKLESNNSKSAFKSNIRLLYYNGLKFCNEYTIGSMTVNTAGAYIFNGYQNYVSYPQVGHIQYAAGLNNFIYLNDLNFGKSKQYYFPATNQIFNLPNSYTRFYSDQLKEINDLNINLLEVDVLLNPVDISNLSLKTPVLLNGADGNSYYKIISIEYNNRFETSTVQLQKIIL